MVSKLESNHSIILPVSLFYCREITFHHEDRSRSNKRNSSCINNISHHIETTSSCESSGITHHIGMNTRSSFVLFRKYLTLPPDLHTSRRTSEIFIYNGEKVLPVRLAGLRAPPVPAIRIGQNIRRSLSIYQRINMKHFPCRALYSHAIR